MRAIFLLTVVVVCSSISCRRTNEAKDALNRVQTNEQVQPVSSFNCSTLKKTLNEGILIASKGDFDDIKIEGLKRVDNGFYESVGLEKIFNAPYSDVEVYFYSYTSLAECSVILFSINQTDDIKYQMHMINMDNGGRLKSYLLLSQHIPYPDGEEFTRSIYSDKSNDVLQITTKSSIGDYNKDTDKYSVIVDSIGSKYNFTESGALKLLERDSVRLIKQ